MAGFRKAWHEIDAAKDASGAVVRRLLPELQHDVRIGQTRPARQRFLELRLFGPVGNVPHYDPSSKGLRVKVILETTERAQIVLEEQSATPTSLFEEVVDDIVGLVETAPSDGVAARTVERLLAWQRFFARPSVELSTDRAAGLFAELTVIESLLLPRVGPLRAIAAWTGPDPALQDFQVPRGAIEVKSFRGTGPGRLRISSERQLEVLPGSELVVAFASLDQRTDGSGRTLADTVNRIADAVRASESASIDFATKLRASGWSDDAQGLRMERYVVRSLEFIRVADGFPAITPAMLPLGVGNVTYHLDRSILEPFVITDEDLVLLLGLSDE